MQPITVMAGDRPVSARKLAPKKRAPSKTKQRKPKSNRPSSAPLLSGLGMCFRKIRNLSAAVSHAKTDLFKKTPSARRRGQSAVYRALVIASLASAVMAPVGAAGYYIVKQSLFQKSLVWAEDVKASTLAAVGLTIQEVSVTGRDRTKIGSLAKVLEIKRGSSILDFDPEAARLRIETLGWVETASVMRRFPDEIFIRISERRPFARWQLKGKTAVIDRNGAIVTARDTKEFKYLPKIVGAGANKDAAELFDMLAKTPALFTRLQNAIRVRDRRWNLEFDNGVTVMLPEIGRNEAWLDLYAMQKEKKVLNKGVMAIDLRSKDKIYVRLKPDDAEMRREHGKET